jgi:MFS family permease
MSVYLLVYLLSAAIGGPLLGSIDQHLGPRVGLFITGAVPGIVIGLVGIRLALLSRRSSPAWPIPSRPARARALRRPAANARTPGGPTG